MVGKRDLYNDVDEARSSTGVTGGPAAPCCTGRASPVAPKGAAKQEPPWQSAAAPGHTPPPRRPPAAILRPGTSGPTHAGASACNTGWHFGRFCAALYAAAAVRPPARAPIAGRPAPAPPRRPSPQPAAQALSDLQGGQGQGGRARAAVRRPAAARPCVQGGLQHNAPARSPRPTRTRACLRDRDARRAAGRHRRLQAREEVPVLQARRNLGGGVGGCGGGMSCTPFAKQTETPAWARTAHARASAHIQTHAPAPLPPRACSRLPQTPPPWPRCRACAR